MMHEWNLLWGSTPGGFCLQRRLSSEFIWDFHEDTRFGKLAGFAWLYLFDFYHEWLRMDKVAISKVSSTSSPFSSFFSGCFHLFSDVFPSQTVEVNF